MRSVTENKKNPLKEKKGQRWLTQKELAERWRVSEGTIINLRKKGELSLFNLPGIKKILYSMDEITRIEQENLSKEVQARNKRDAHKHTELLRKEPVMSAKPEKEWRI